MILASHWRDNGDGTVWVVSGIGGLEGSWRHHDRQCDVSECRGGEVSYPEWEGDVRPCVDCGGTGRHMFEVEAAPDWAVPDRGLPVTPVVYTVSVVPGMVLPIVDDYNDPPTGPGCSAVRMADRPWVLTPNGRGFRSEVVTLPGAAVPGMWAVLLRIHEEG